MSVPRLHPNFFLTENDKLAPRGSVILDAGGNPSSRRLIQPSHPFDWSSFSSVTWAWEVRQVNGAPTTGIIRPRLEIGITHTFGYQYTNPVWRTLTRAEAAAYCFDGQWLPDLEIAPAVPASGDTPAIPAKTITPGVYFARIDNPPAAMRINFGESGPDAMAFTGGTLPNLQSALVAYGKV